MDVISNCPLRVASLHWQATSQRWMLTVIAKATFSLIPVTCAFADEQEDPIEHENHWDDDPKRSLYAPSDFVPFKQQPEVTLVGNAFAPQGGPVSQLMVRLVVGNVDKSIVVHADRSFSQDGVLRTGARFRSMPLRYERAAGGPDTTNPVGVIRRMDALGVVHLPNLEPPGLNVTRPDEHIDPIGFAPLAASWPTRRERLGRNAWRWSPAALVVEPVPEWLDLRYFMSAPPDQYLDELRSNERIVLENLNRDHPRLVTSLPGCEPRAFVERPGLPVAPLPMTCDTLWIDTDRSICTLTWRAWLRLEDRDQEGRVVIGMGMLGQPLAWPEMAAPARKADDVDRVESVVVTDATSTHVASRLFDGVEGGQPWPSWLTSSNSEEKIQPPPPVFAAPVPLGVPVPPNASVEVAASVWAPRVQSAPSPLARPASGAAPAMTMDQRATAGALEPRRSVASAGLPASDSGTTPAHARSPESVREAATRGAAAASNAAAAEAEVRIPTVAARDGDARAQAAREAPRDHVDLIWYDVDAAPRIHKADADRSLQRRPVTWVTADTPLRETPEAKVRREVLAILTRGAALDEAALAKATSAAYQDDGTFEGPIGLIAGELSFAFDSLETLRATIIVVTPFVGNDKKLKDAVTAGTEVVKSEWGVSADVAEGTTRRIEEAFAQGQRSVAPKYLENSVEKILLEGRLYQKKNLMGASRIRAFFSLSSGGAPIPTYLPEALAPKLPLFLRFKAKAIVEIRPQEDQYETHADALLVLALGRVLRRADEEDQARRRA